VSSTNKALSAAGIKYRLPVDPAGQLRSILQAAGVDVSNQAVLYLITNSAATLMDTKLTPIATLNLTIAGLAKTYPAPQAPGVADYATALKTYGFGSGFDQFTAQAAGLDPNAVAQGGAPRVGRPGDVPATLRTVDTQGYVIADNGAVLFKNGVIFDPALVGSPGGGLHFPQADPNVVGSPSWMHSVTSWGAAKVQEWRKTLGEQGYLQPSEALNGSGSVDATFLDAIQRYQMARYQNYGTPMALSNVDLSKYGPTGNKIVDYSQMRGTIVANVRSQYRTSFGQDPSAGEQKSWADFVVREAMRLQQQGLDPSQALTEAGAEFTNKANQSPQGQYLSTHADENTSLHNALTSAVAATVSVTR
jgi:hypothetical protein